MFKFNFKLKQQFYIVLMLNEQSYGILRFFEIKNIYSFTSKLI